MSATATAPDPLHLNKRDAAQRLGISVRSLDRIDDLPRVKIRGKVLFRRDTLDAWSREHESK